MHVPGGRQRQREADEESPQREQERRDPCKRPETELDLGDGDADAGEGGCGARTLVEAQGGRMWLEETPGGGLTAAISLPAVQRAAEVPTP